MALIECKECGQMISDKATVCPKCGYPVETTLQTQQVNTDAATEETPADTHDMNDETSNYQKDEKQAGNTNPGAASSASYKYVQPSKDKIVAAVLAFFLGVLGIHHFYLGNNDRGLSYLIVYFATWVIYTVFGLITFGVGYALYLPIIMTVVSIIDMVHYLQDNNDSFQERIQREKDPLWKKVIY